MIQSGFKKHTFSLTNLVNRNPEDWNHHRGAWQNHWDSTPELLLETKSKVRRLFCLSLFLPSSLKSLEDLASNWQGKAGAPAPARSCRISSWEGSQCPSGATETSVGFLCSCNWLSSPKSRSFTSPNRIVFLSGHLGNLLSTFRA